MASDSRLAAKRGLCWLQLAAALALSGVLCCGEGVAPEAPGDERVVARVNGEAVTVQAFQESLEILPGFVRREMEGEVAYLRHFGQLLNFVLLAQEAERLGLDHGAAVTLSMREAEVEALWQSLATGLDLGPVDDAALMARYEAAPERYRVPERYVILRLLVRDPARLEALVRSYWLSCGARAGAGLGCDADFFQSFAAMHSEARGESVRVGPFDRRDAGVVLPEALVHAVESLGAVGRLAPALRERGWSTLFMIVEREAGEAMVGDERLNAVRQTLLDEALAEVQAELTRSVLSQAAIEVLRPDLAGALDLLRR